MFAKAKRLLENSVENGDIKSKASSEGKKTKKKRQGKKERKRKRERIYQDMQRKTRSSSTR